MGAIIGGGWRIVPRVCSLRRPLGHRGRIDREMAAVVDIGEGRWGLKFGDIEAV